MSIVGTREAVHESPGRQNKPITTMILKFGFFRHETGSVSPYGVGLV